MTDSLDRPQQKVVVDWWSSCGRGVRRLNLFPRLSPLACAASGLGCMRPLASANVASVAPGEKEILCYGGLASIVVV